MSSRFVHSSESNAHIDRGLSGYTVRPIDERPGMIVFDPDVREGNPDWPSGGSNDGGQTRDDRRDTGGGSGHRYPGRGGDDDGGRDRDGDNGGDNGGDRGDTDHPNDGGGNGCTGILGCRDGDDDGDSGGNDDGNGNGNGNGNGGSDDGGSDDGGSNDGGSNDGGSNNGGSNNGGSNNGGSNNGGGYTPGIPEGIDVSALQAFYNDNRVAVWSGGGVLALLLLLK